jgi:hypothetical protein
MSRAGSLPIVVAVAALAFAACGGGGAKKVDPAADLALANAAVINSADLPGYASSPHTNADEPPSQIRSDFASCVHEPSTILDDIPGAQKVYSADFSKNPTFVSGSVSIAASTNDMDNAWASISKSGIESCFEEFFREAVKVGITESEGISFGPTAVDRFEPGVGARSVGYAVKITASGPGAADVFFSDFIFVQRDRAGIVLAFTNSGSPLDRSFENGLAQTVYDRIGDKAK